jgi:hypothetical protein
MRFDKVKQGQIVEIRSDKTRGTVTSLKLDPQLVANFKPDDQLVCIDTGGGRTVEVMAVYLKLIAETTEELKKDAPRRFDKKFTKILKKTTKAHLKSSVQKNKKSK